jgi:hypothetical protein
MANIRLVSAIAVTAISFSVSVNSVSSVVSDGNKISATVNTSRLGIKAFELVPTRKKFDSVSITDSPVLEISLIPGDSVTSSDSDPVFDAQLVKSDSVTVTDTPNKIINSSVDFDPSDDDVDPDPINVTDSDAKTITPAGKTDSVSASDSPALQPDIPQSDSITASESNIKTINTVPTDSVSVSESDAKTINTVPTDSVSASESDAKEFTTSRSDSVTMSESSILQPSIVKADSVIPSDAVNSITVDLVSTDSVSASESISTTLTLGVTTPMYPELVNISDGTVGFIFTRDEPNTGIIGGPGYVGQIIVNDDKITEGDSSNAGLVVTFHYTDVDDSSLGGHVCNATPLSAGANT